MAADDHGSVSTYTNHRCRCAACKKAATDAQRADRVVRVQRLTANPRLREHGSNTTYTEWGCRCQPCKDAHTDAARRRRKRRANP